MPPTTTAPDASTGLFSSVFSFVSREVKSFVNSAAGKSAEEDLFDDEGFSDEEDVSEEPKSSLKCSGGRTERAVTSNSNKRSSAHAGVGGTSYSPSPASSNRRTRKGFEEEETSPLSTRYHPLRRTQDEYSEEELSGSEGVRTPSPRPPLARHPLRRASITMPGALYQRSSSLEPSPEADWERSRVVRFAPGIESPPAGQRSASRQVEYGAGPSRPSPPSSSPHKAGYIHRSKDGKALHAARRFSDDNPSRVSLMLPQSPDKFTTRGVRLQANGGKGKERQAYTTEDANGCQRSDDEQGVIIAEATYETRVRGKERELRNAIDQERDQQDDEERKRDKERIKILEEEVKKLREELAKKSSAPQQAFFPPPPPPPPPPIPIIGISDRMPFNQPQPDGLFASARASLRPTAAPSETAINPAYAAPSAKRKGQPTINIGADKMADFLKEMKTHRLRKVGSSGQMNMSLDSSVQPYKVQRPPPAMRAREVGGEVGNRSEVIPNKASEISFAIPSLKNRSYSIEDCLNPERVVGNDSLDLKRKRHAQAGEDPPPYSSNKRRVLDPSLNGSEMALPALGARLTAATALSASRNPILGGRVINSNNPPPSVTDPILSQTRWSSSISKSGTDITTPSLCSDTEQGDEPSLEDRPPATPPLSPSHSRSRSISVDSSQEQGREKSRTRIQILNDSSLSRMARSRNEAQIMAGEQTMSESAVRSQNDSTFLRIPKDVFASRPPSSPMLVDSPKKPRPPARTKVKPAQRLYEGLAEEEEDPLALSFRASSREISVHQSEPLNEQLSNRKGPSHSMRLLSKATRSTRTPVQDGNNKNPSSAVTRRRETLDVELRRVDSSYSDYEHELVEDIYADDVQTESGTLSGVGTRANKEGFIAHGGAGGVPVVMGPGNVERPNDEDSEDLPKRPSSRGKRRPSNATSVNSGKKKGRSRI